VLSFEVYLLTFPKNNLSNICADKGVVGTSPQIKKAPEAASVKPPAKFVARQPILTREEQVFGYELLFRDGVENYFRATDPDARRAARSIHPC